jgi:hypothetical protein
MPDIDKQVQKDAIKEALREWLNDQYAEFGKWTARSIVAVVLAGLVWFWASSHGWTR